jgi:ribosome-binding protein aMBF1 (putative translation factor)
MEASVNLAKCGLCGKEWDDETQSLVCPHAELLPVVIQCPTCLLIFGSPNHQQNVENYRRHKRSTHAPQF